MPIDLPDPPSTGDIWGEELNTAIESLEVIANNALSVANQALTLASTGGDSGILIENADDNSVDIVTGDGTRHTVILSIATTAPYGVAGLDGNGKVPRAELTGVLGPLDVGGAATAHQHSLSDIPGINLSVNAGPLIATFNTATSQWPFRTTLTSSPTQCVIWAGDADIPTYAVPGIDFFFGPRQSGTTTTTPTPPPDPTPTPDANDITLAAPVVTVNGSSFFATASITTTVDTLFTYLQIAVRGPNGEQQDMAYANGGRVDGPGSIGGTGNATSVGTWRCYLTYNLTGGPAQSDWVDGPATTFAITTLGGVPTPPVGDPGTPGSGIFPVLNRSGHSWNSGVCDASNGGVPEVNAFGNWRGSACDANMFFNTRDSFANMAYIPDALTSWPGYRVISTPSQPTTLENSYAAGGSANGFWLQYGLDLKNKGWNDGRTILRLNWECNGDWYMWSWHRQGASTFVNAVKNVVNNVRTHCPTIKVDICLNRGNVNGGINWATQIMDPLIGWVDIIGLDNYDFSPPSFNDSQWNSMAAIDPGLNSVSAYCRAKGLKMSIDEWGICSTISGNGTTYPGGFDNPYYIHKMYLWMVDNDDVFGMDLYFNINADNLNQRLYPVSESTKPNSGVQYQADF